jgi:cold shock CspA family protein
VLQYPAQSDLGRSTVRFATKKLSRHPTSPLVARHAKSVAASFLRLDQETGDTKRHRQVVQPDQGLSTLNENQVVEYDLVENRGKNSAENLKVS